MVQALHLTLRSKCNSSSDLNATLVATRPAPAISTIGLGGVRSSWQGFRHTKTSVRVRCWCSHSNVMLGKMSVLLNLPHRFKIKVLTFMVQQTLHNRNPDHAGASHNKFSHHVCIPTLRRVVIRCRRCYLPCFATSSAEEALSPDLGCAVHQDLVASIIDPVLCFSNPHSAQPTS